MLRLSVLLVALALVRASYASGCTTESLTAIELTSLPNSISEELSAAALTDASVFTIGSELSVMEISTPALQFVESVIVSYIYTSPSVVQYFEEYAEYPSGITDESAFAQFEAEYYTLATAIASLQTIEASHVSLDHIQSSLQILMETDSSILTYLSDYTMYASPSICADTRVIELAALTSPSIVTDFLSVVTAVSLQSAVSGAISSLSYYFYYLPSTVDSYVLQYISSPGTISPTIVSYLSYYFYSVYQDATIVTGFTELDSSVVPALTSYLAAASNELSIGSALESIVTEQMPTFTYQESVLDSAISYWYSAVSDLSEIERLTVSSSTLSSALRYLEQTFYDSPEVASSLFQAVNSPAAVSRPEKVQDEKMSHQSFIEALEEVFNFESSHSSLEESLSQIVSYLTEVWKSDGTLLTAYTFISSLVSPSTESDEASLSTLNTVVSQWSTVLSAIVSATQSHPSLQAPECVIGPFAYEDSTLVSTLWSVINSVSQYSAEASYFASLEASYSNLVSALESIASYETAFTWLASDEASLISVLASDSQALTQFSQYVQIFSSS